MEELKERLKTIDSCLIAYQYIVGQLYQERYLVEGCIKNPSSDNLQILETYNKQCQDFIQGLIKK